jgi:hypothetical protein
MIALSATQSSAIRHGVSAMGIKAQGGLRHRNPPLYEIWNVQTMRLRRRMATNNGSIANASHPA